LLAVKNAVNRAESIKKMHISHASFANRLQILLYTLQ